VRVVGVDVNPAAVATAASHSADLALVRDEPGIEEKITTFTGGIGCDAVIITAASDSLDPINFAGAIARKRGTLVVVGTAPTGFDREPHFYKKELTVRMSCSQNKGQKEMVRAFVGAVRVGGATPIPFEDIYAVTLTTFRIFESLQERQAVDI